MESISLKTPSAVFFHRGESRSMSLFELLWLTFLILCAVLVGHSLAHRLGTLGWWLGVPAGLALWIAITQIVIKTAYRFRPNAPVCRNEKCFAKDYSVLKFTPDGVMFRCRCGNTYLKSKNRFVEVLPDGSVHPYMRRSTWRNWRPDSAN